MAKGGGWHSKSDIVTQLLIGEENHLTTRTCRQPKIDDGIFGILTGARHRWHLMIFSKIMHLSIR
jgi:hypothetical protein